MAFIDYDSECSLKLDSSSLCFAPGSIASGKVSAVFRSRAIYYKKLSIGVHGFFKIPYEQSETEEVLDETEIVLWSYEPHSNATLQCEKLYEFHFQIRLPPATPLSFECNSWYALKYYIKFIGLTNVSAEIDLCETPLHVVQRTDLNTALLRQPVQTRRVILKNFLFGSGGSISILAEMPHTGFYAGDYMPLSLVVQNDTRWNGSVCAKILAVEKWNIYSERLVHTRYKLKERLAKYSTVRWGSDKILISNTGDMHSHHGPTLDRRFIFQVKVKGLCGSIDPLEIPITIGLAQDPSSANTTTSPGQGDPTSANTTTSPGKGEQKTTTSPGQGEPTTISPGKGNPTSASTTSFSQAGLQTQELTSAGGSKNNATTTAVSDMYTKPPPSYEDALRHMNDYDYSMI